MIAAPPLCSQFSFFYSFYCIISSTDVALTQVVHLVYAGFRLVQTIPLPPRRAHIRALVRSTATTPRSPGGGASAPASNPPSASLGNNRNPAVPVSDTSRRRLRHTRRRGSLSAATARHLLRGEGDGGWGHPFRAARYKILVSFRSFIYLPFRYNDNNNNAYELRT